MMGQRAPFTAMLLPDRQTVRMARGTWWLEVPAADLRRWLKMYRDLRDRKRPVDAKGQPNGAGPYHHIYAPCVTALEAVAKAIMEAK